MNREEFKLRMKSLKSYRELNPGKGYWDWKVEAFLTGGETDDVGEASLQQILARSWLENWFRNRPKQMAENISRYGKLYYYGSDIDRSKVTPWFWQNKEKNARRVAELIIDLIHSTPVFDYREPWVANDGNALNRKEFLKLPAGVQGAYFKNYPERDAISISPITSSPSVLVHEYTHASQNEYGIQTNKVYEILKKHKKENGKEDSYFDKPDEVYAREMEFRYLNNIQPEDVITKEQIEKWKKDGGVVDPNFISRYSTNTLEDLLNGVAQAYAGGGLTGDDDNERVQREINQMLGRTYYGVPLELGLKPVIDIEDAANLTPIGDAMAIKDTYNAVKDNDWVTAGLAAIGVLPFVPSGLQRVSKVKKQTPNKYAISAIQQAEKLPTQNPNTIASLAEVPRASQNIPTSGDKIRLMRSSRGNSRLSPEALETIQYIKENVESLPEFRNPMYYDAFMKHMDDLGIETDIIELSPKTLAQVLTDQYNQLTNTATGVVKNKIFGRVDPKSFTEFDWQSHLAEFSGNPGFWGAGNYFSTGMSKSMRPFIISDIDELAYDNAFSAFNDLNNAGIHKATKWMLDNPEKRMVVSIPDNGMSNKYGFVNEGKDYGIEVVTLKNTGIKSLFPDFTTGDGKTFVRDWNNPNIFYANGGLVGDDIKGSYSNHTGTPTMYVPVTKDYEATPDGFGGIANVHTPEVVITPLNNISLEAAVDRGRRDAAPYVGAIVGGAAAGAMSSAGLLSPVVNPIDIASVAIDPSDPLNWLPFGLHFGNRTYKAGRLILDPKKRAAHAYVNISPVGYEDVGKRAKSWISDMLKGEDADIQHPKWSLDELGLRTQDYIPQDVVNREKIAAYTRDDAWRIYNGLEPKYGMYIKNGDGTYSYDMQKILEMSEGTFKPHKFKRDVTATDYVTGSGGGLTKMENTDIAKQGRKTYSVQTIEDIWDLNPFSRPTDLLIHKYPSLGKPFLFYNKIRNDYADFLTNISSLLKYDDKAIKNYLKSASDYEIDTFDPDMFARQGLRYNIGKNIDKLSKIVRPTKNWYEYKPIDKLNEFGKKFEVGMISGGKPFKMHTEIPYTSYADFGNVDASKPGQLSFKVNFDYGFTPNEGMMLPPEVYLYKNSGYKLPKLNFDKNIENIIKDIIKK